MDQKNRRDKGMLYLTDDELIEELNDARRLIQKLNSIDRTNLTGILKIALELLDCNDTLLLNPPFFCDYGYNIEIGNNCLINYNCTFIDVAHIKLGDFCLIGPNVSIYTAAHPLHPVSRNCNFTCGVPVTIGDNVWIGGGVIICPGVTIGSNCVIGAGSVVTRDIPSWSVAAGNPCKVIREITDDDIDLYFKDRIIDEEAQNVIRKKKEESENDKYFPYKEDR